MAHQGVRETNLRTALADVARTLDLGARVKEHPYGTLAAAAGAGYVLAGGLFTRLTARTLKLGLRVGASLAVWPLLQQGLADMAEPFRAARAPRSKEVRDGRAAKGRE